MSEFLKKLRDKHTQVLNTLTAIDPGSRADRPNMGWALFLKSRLLAAGIVRSKEELPQDSVKIIVIEAPRWYPREYKIDTNDLLDLSILVGKIQGMYEERGQTVQLVWPRSWKGTVSKKIHNPRVLAALTKEEIVLLPRRPRAKDHDHNMLDAVGIGLWKLGRM